MGLPGGRPVVNTPRFHCRRHLLLQGAWVQSLIGELDPVCLVAQPKKKKRAAKRRETLEVPVLSGQKASRERALSWDASQLFQASRTSDPSSITLGILLYFKIRHIIIITC